MSLIRVNCPDYSVTILYKNTDFLDRASAVNMIYLDFSKAFAVLSHMPLVQLGGAGLAEERTAEGARSPAAEMPVGCDWLGCGAAQVGAGKVHGEAGWIWSCWHCNRQLEHRVRRKG